MKVYIESIFLLNFLLDFMILFGTKKILKHPTTFLRIGLGSGVGMLSTFLLFIPISSVSLFFWKIIISCSMIFISFGKRHFFRSLFYFYIFSILLGGFLYLFDIPKSFFRLSLFTLFSCFWLIHLFGKAFFRTREISENRYQVVVTIQQKDYFLDGFLDTGNRLKNPYGGEAILLTNLKLSVKDCFYVPYKALNSSGIIPCVRPDRIVINQKEIHHCLIGLARERFSMDGFNCILPNQIKEDLC